MAEVTNELIYEVLKAMQTRLGNMEESLGEMRGEVGALRTTMYGSHKDTGNPYAAFMALDGRLARIECRLDIVDAPVA